MKDAGADGFQVVPLTQSEGYISAEYAYLYPPGIPMLVAGGTDHSADPGTFSMVYGKNI